VAVALPRGFCLLGVASNELDVEPRVRAMVEFHVSVHNRVAAPRAMSCERCLGLETIGQLCGFSIALRAAVTQ